MWSWIRSQRESLLVLLRMSGAWGNARYEIPACGAGPPGAEG